MSKTSTNFDFVRMSNAGTNFASITYLERQYWIKQANRARRATLRRRSSINKFCVTAYYKIEDDRAWCRMLHSEFLLIWPTARSMALFLCV